MPTMPGRSQRRWNSMHLPTMEYLRVFTPEPSLKVPARKAGPTLLHVVSWEPLPIQSSKRAPLPSEPPLTLTLTSSFPSAAATAWETEASRRTSHCSKSSAGPCLGYCLDSSRCFARSVAGRRGTDAAASSRFSARWPAESRAGAAISLRCPHRSQRRCRTNRVAWRSPTRSASPCGPHAGGALRRLRTCYGTAMVCRCSRQVN
jgi:hypothetical protein